MSRCPDNSDKKPSMSRKVKILSKISSISMMISIVNLKNQKHLKILSLKFKIEMMLVTSGLLQVIMKKHLNSGGILWQPFSRKSTLYRIIMKFWIRISLTLWNKSERRKSSLLYAFCIKYLTLLVGTSYKFKKLQLTLLVILHTLSLKPVLIILNHILCTKISG